MPSKRWKGSCRVWVEDHAPTPRHRHPTPLVEARYCACGSAIVKVAGVWWHLVRVPPKRSSGKGDKA